MFTVCGFLKKLKARHMLALCKTMAAVRNAKAAPASLPRINSDKPRPKAAVVAESPILATNDPNCHPISAATRHSGWFDDTPWLCLARKPVPKSPASPQPLRVRAL